MSQLKPLKDRLNDSQQDRRTRKIQARQTLAEGLTAGLQYVIRETEVLRRPLKGRLTWLVTGR